MGGLHDSVRKAAEMEQSKLPWSRPPGADHGKAIRMAGDLAGREGVSAAAVYNAACAFALATADQGADASERRRRADQAMTSLRRLDAQGYFAGGRQARELRNDPDPDPLRSRPDFRDLAARVTGETSTAATP